MGLNTDYKTAVELTGAAQAAAEALDAAMPMAEWLPTKQNPTLSYSFDASAVKPVDVAGYRAFDTEAPYGQLGPTITKEGKLPPISRKLPVSEFTELSFSNQLSALGTKLEDYAARLGAGVAARLELARVEALLTGKLVLAENGITATIDYGRDPALTIPLPGAAAARWDSADSTPVDDLIAWRELVKVASHGSLPSALAVSNRVLSALQANKQVIAFALGRSDKLPTRVSTEAVQQVLSGMAGITRLVVADDAYSVYDFGRPVFPDGQVVLLPPSGGLAIGGEGSLGSTDFGVTAEAIQPSYGIGEGERAGIFSGAFDRHDPEGLDVLVSAVALPLVQRANATLGATVIATAPLG
ncbi:MAG: major capsid protein [Propionibacteriaceae bacterium]|jgi:hypothetical protein|nr:major capsid protein [Propionibacteriaceae bacterium]